jgi:hypothetical protein
VRTASPLSADQQHKRLRASTRSFVGNVSGTTDWLAGNMNGSACVSADNPLAGLLADPQSGSALVSLSNEVKRGY